MKIVKPFFLLFLIIYSPLTFASGDFQLSLSPFTGSGNTSFGADVRSANGVSLALYSRYNFGIFTLGPKVEITNSLFSTKSSISNTQTIVSYDNILLSFGFILASQDFLPLKTSLYLAPSGGLGWSDLSVSENSSTSFNQFDQSGARGNYFAFEFGTLTKVNNDKLQIMAAFTTSRYFIDQSQLAGTHFYEQTNPITGGLNLNDGGDNAQDTPQIDTAVTQTFYGFKAGILLQI